MATNHENFLFSVDGKHLAHQFQLRVFVTIIRYIILSIFIAGDLPFAPFFSIGKFQLKIRLTEHGFPEIAQVFSLFLDFFSGALGHLLGVCVHRGVVGVVTRSVARIVVGVPMLVMNSLFKQIMVSP